MFFDRSALKQRTKRMVWQGAPPVWQVTLVYILATTWVSNVVQLVVKNPINSAVEVINTWTNKLAQMDIVSQGAMDALTQQIWACFRGPAAMIGLLAAVLLAFYSMVVGLGYYSYSLRVMRGQEAGYGDLFSHFYLVGRLFLLMILKAVFIYLWSLLFIIPGIVASYRYRMAEYCLLDDPDISALEAIRRSKALMQGQKGTLFVLDLSFLGWLILQGVAYELARQLVYAATGVTVAANLVALAVDTAIALFVLSYQQLTEAGFYLFVLGNQAPPVENADQFNRPNGYFDNSDEGWNR